MALSVFCFITIRAGIYPAIIVATNNIPARRSVPPRVATRIPSENGKSSGLASKYGFIMKNIRTIPMIIPPEAYINA